MPLTYGPRLEGLRVEPLRTYVGLKLNNHDWRNPLQGATPMHICPNEVKVKWRSHHSEIREKGMTGNKTATIHVRVCLGATSFGPLQPVFYCEGAQVHRRRFLAERGNLFVFAFFVRSRCGKGRVTSSACTAEFNYGV